MTAQEAFDAASKGGFNDLVTVLAICRRHGDYCVIGGLALLPEELRRQLPEK